MNYQMDLMLIDMKWGISEYVSNEYSLTKIYLDELEKCKRESHFIVSKYLFICLYYSGHSQPKILNVHER